MTTTDICFEASKLLPFQPDWAELRRLCEELTVDGVAPTAVALARAYTERVAQRVVKK